VATFAKPFAVFGDSVYCSYRYNNARKCDISNEILRIYAGSGKG